MIWRSCTCASLLLVLSAGTAPTALAAGDSSSAVLADCGSPDIPASTVDSCLERARVLDETSPSPELQSLEAQLEQRETGGRAARRQPRPLQTQADPPASNTARYDSQPVVVESPHNLSPDAAEPDQSRTAAADKPATARSEMRGSDEEKWGSIDGGADRPPPGINEDQPPVADPPDSTASRDEESDPPDDMQ